MTLEARRGPAHHMHAPVSGAIRRASLPGALLLGNLRQVTALTVN